jgi:pyruvate/2-oxoglutarate dehydrogenase complex dihydrolipoamide acyltransferase (E2) component
MVHNVALEKVDANMEEATVGAWLVAEGDPLAVGQKFVELITDKVTFQYESPVAGTVLKLLAAPGGVAPVGYVLCQVGDPGEAPPDVSAHNRELLEAQRRRTEVTIDTSAAVAAAPAGGGGRVRATPAARRLAREHGIELADVAPAQPGGIISEEDVAAHLAGGR